MYACLCTTLTKQGASYSNKKATTARICTIIIFVSFQVLRLSLSSCNNHRVYPATTYYVQVCIGALYRTSHNKKVNESLHVEQIKSILLLYIMHLSMQSPTPPPPPPHPEKGGDLSQRGCKRRTPGAELFG